VRPFPLVVGRERLNTSKMALRWLGRLTNNDMADRLLNRDYIQAYRTISIPELTSTGKRVVGDLTSHGIAFAKLDEFLGPDCLGMLVAAFDTYHQAFKAQEGGKKKGKAVYITTIHKSHTFVADDFVSDFLAFPEFSAIAAHYMGMVPRFVGNSFWHTYPAPVEERMYSQQWHRDYNDRRLVKVFLYLNDVGELNGPFEYLSGSHGLGPLANKYNRTGDDGYRAYPNNEEVERFLLSYSTVKLDGVEECRRHNGGAPANIPVRILCTGPAGTLIFADTFGLHRGGYVQSGHRNMIMTTFSTNANVHRPHFELTPEFASRLSPFMRMVFGLG
jgi:Phytanoyl-CoA dioxygenase (PhyH)